MTGSGGSGRGGAGGGADQGPGAAGEPRRPVFDPRHDAIYQRGYQPGDAVPAPVTVPGPEPVRAGPIGPPLETRSAGNEPDSPVAVPLDEFDTLLFDGDDFSDVPVRSRWNPFIAVLWALAALLTGGAGTLQWQAATMTFSNYSYAGSGPLPFGMLIQQVSYSASPSALTAGLLTMAGLLFWHAWAWRVRRQSLAGQA